MSPSGGSPYFASPGERWRAWGSLGILSNYFTWLFNGSGESLIPGLLFHATQNWEEGFETLFPGLVGTDWELVSTLDLLVAGVIAGFVVWRQSRGGKYD